MTRLSVTIPTLNEGYYLPSLLAALNQPPGWSDELIGPTSAALFDSREGIASLEESDQDGELYAPDALA